MTELEYLRDEVERLRESISEICSKVVFSDDGDNDLAVMVHDIIPNSERREREYHLRRVLV